MQKTYFTPLLCVRIWSETDIITSSVDTTVQQYADGDHIQWWPSQSQE